MNDFHPHHESSRVNYRDPLLDSLNANDIAIENRKPGHIS
jgi:hypothetical protein